MRHEDAIVGAGKPKGAFGPPTFLLGWLPSFRSLEPRTGAGLLSAADRFIRAAPSGSPEEWDARARVVRALVDASGDIARATGVDRNDLARAVSAALDRLSLRPLDFGSPAGISAALRELSSQVIEELKKKDEKIGERLTPEVLTALAIGGIHRQFEFEEWAASLPMARPGGQFRPSPSLPGLRFRLPSLPSPFRPLPSPFAGGNLGARGNLRDALPRLGLPRG